MSQTAILVDGGFYRKIANHKWGQHPPKEAAQALFKYCIRHLKERERQHDLYRIFYYDCPPIKKQIYHPLTQSTIDFSKTEQYKWMSDFLDELKHILTGFYNLSYQIRDFFFILYFGFKLIDSAFNKVQLVRNR